MTVRFDRLDLILSSRLMSDGSGSRCRMMSESPRKFNIFTAHIVANVSIGPFFFFNCGHAVPKSSHMHAQHFHLWPSFNMRESHCITRSSLSSMMPSVRLCGSACSLLNTHDVERADVSIFRNRKTHVEQWSILLLTRQESCRRLSDLGQSASRLHLDNCDLFDCWQ